MERLKMIKENLMSVVQSQMGDLQRVDAKELGEAVDMIKDLEEAMYYCSIVKAMEDSEKDKSSTMKYTYPPVMYNGNSFDTNDRMYYDGNRRGNGTTYPMDGRRMYYNGERWTTYPHDYDSTYPMEIRDYREGKSPMTRRMYMESKELHQGKEKQMKELEKYMNELTQDIMEMINDATPEEKAILSQKLNTLADKID